MLLVKSLYGHPEAGAHWEAHLEKVILEELRGEPVDGHPSSFCIPDMQLLLTVYVDDLLLSGPTERHAVFWKKLSAKIELEEVEDLD